MTTFWKPGSTTTTTPKSTILLDNDRNDDVPFLPFNFNSASIHQQRLNLPIARHRRQILYAMEKYKIVVIVGETGSGKSTQIPQYLFEAGWATSPFQIICTQPRRLAAITLAQRICSERSDPSIASHSVRFSSNATPSTKIKFVTDQMLVRESLADPLLQTYSVIMVDEAHERGLNSDVLLGILKQIRRKRTDLRIVVCSATIDANAFLDYFCLPKKKKRKKVLGPEAMKEGVILSIDGRQYPVDILYSEQPVANYLQSCVDTALQIHFRETNGDVLCFLPSGEDIDNAIRLAEESLQRHPSFQQRRSMAPPAFLPLYGSLPYHLQARIFQPSSSSKQQRRIIFSTNIAETSVTVPNIKYVIDCGYVKLPYFDPRNGFERLITSPVSRAQAIQRAGRAGRIAPGKCYRLYTEQTMSRQLQEATPPEIQRTNLTSFVLTVKALGIDDLHGFDLMTDPNQASIVHALESLFALRALDEGCRLTKEGLKMCEFPCDPRVAKMLLYSLECNCSEEVLSVAAVLQVRDLFVRPRTDQQKLDFEESLGDVLEGSYGDHVTYVNVMERDGEKSEEECKDVFVNCLAIRRANEVRAQLKRFLKRYGDMHSIDVAGDMERSRMIRKSVTAGFFFNVAKLGSDGRYYSLRGKHLVKISNLSMLGQYGESTEYILFGETYDGSKGGLEVRHCSAIEGKWLRELAPHYWK